MGRGVLGVGSGPIDRSHDEVSVDEFVDQSNGECLFGIDNPS